MNKIFKYIIFLAVLPLMAITMVSCDTDVESVDINEPGVENQNPALYAQYLTNVRAFKAKKHKVTLGWYDNSAKTYSNGSQHINALPDSLDYVVMMYPDSLSELDLQEIKEIKEQKSTKTLYSIDFSEIEAAYEKAAAQLILDQTDGKRKDEKMPVFDDFVKDSVKIALSFCDKYNYDGVIFAFESMYKGHLNNAAKAEVASKEDSFVHLAIDWHLSHPEKELMYEGTPENISDFVILDDAKYIILPCRSIVSKENLYYFYQTQCVGNVPADKFIVLCETISYDKNDAKTGYFLDGSLAVVSTAEAIASSNFNVSAQGLGVYNIQRDFFNTSYRYLNVRKAISLINPTVNK
jgi:hypothetical protein